MKATNAEGRLMLRH